MKKVLSVILSLLITLSSFSVLSVISFAADESGTETGGEAAYTFTGFTPADEHSSVYSPYQYTGGIWNYCKDEETGVWSYEYEYDFYDIYLEGNKLNFVDSDGYPVEFVCVDGQFCNADGEVLDDSQLVVEPNENKGKLYIKITYGDNTVQYPVIFADSGIESICAENTPYELSAYIDGRYMRLSEGENAGEVAFFYDTLYCEGVSFVVTYKNGDEERFAYSEDEGTFVNGDGELLTFDSFSFTESQDYEEWQPGGDYAVKCYYKGFGFEVPYTVSENPVKSVEYTQAEIPQYKENWDGELSYCENEDCENCEDSYFNYTISKHFPVQGDKVKVTYADDTAVEYTYKGRYYVDSQGNRLPSQSLVCHNDQNKAHWSVGENTFIFEVYGHNVELTANVTESGIKSVEFAPVNILENNFGEWDEEADAYIYSELPFINGANFTVTFTDGNSITYYYDKESGWFVDNAGNMFEFEINTETTDQHQTPWRIGKHYLPVDVSGFETQLEVNVAANPVAAIAFMPAQPYVFKYEQDGEWVEIEDPETGEYKEIFWYDTSVCNPYTEGNKLAVQYKDGRTEVYTYSEDKGNFFNENGDEISALYNVKIEDCQCYNLWSMDDGDNNYLKVSFMGVSCTVRVLLDNGEAPVAATVTAVKSQKDNVKITWNHVANAESYTVYKKTTDRDGKYTGEWEIVGNTTECVYQEKINNSTEPYYYVYIVHAQNSYGQSEYEASKEAYAKYVPAVKGFNVAPNKKGVSIKWNAFAGQIEIYRRAAGETKWTYLATLDGNKKSVIDPNVKSGTYYKYTAIRVDGNNKSEKVESSLIKYLATPHLSTIKNAASGIYLNWTKAEGASGYRVYRRGEGEKYYTLIATTKNLWYCDQAIGSQMGKYYKYTVKAVWGSYLSDCEDGLVLQRNLFPTLTSVSNTNNGVVVKWNKLNKATEYRVYRRGAGQTTWTYLGTTKNLQFLDKGVKNYGGNYYRYTVRAMFGKTYGTFDTNGRVILRLAAPEITRVKNDANGVKVEFNAVKGATGYYVYHKVGKSSWVRVGSTTKTSFVDMDVKAGTSYVYTVKAYKGSYMSDYVATTTPLIYVPAPAVNTPINTSNGIKITWQEVPMAETYYVGRRDVGGIWKTIKTISKSEVKKDSYGQIYYVDTTAVEGKTYNYSVRAYAKGTSSGYSENRFGTFFPPVDVLSAQNVDGGIKITWEKSPKATDYVIWRKADDGSRLEAINVKNVTSYVDKDVRSGTKYTYEVWAFGGPKGMSSSSVAGASKSCTAK